MSDSTLNPDGDPASTVGPLREVWSIAWPTVLTMASYTVMQFIDKLMVGQVGPLEVAAHGNGGIWAYTPISVTLGILTVVNTFVSQNLGAGTPRNGPRYAWAALWLSLLTWLVLLLPLAVVLPWIFRAMHDPATVVEVDRLVTLESSYGRLLLVGGLFTLCGRGLHHFYFGLHRPKIVTVSAILGNVTNVVANYVLIFGEAGVPHLGLPGVPGVPALGLIGAGIGTVMGTFVEMALPAVIFFGRRLDAELGTRAPWRPALGPIRDLLRVGWPAAAQYGNELLCWSIFMTILVGRFGADHLTAGWIALGYMHLSFMPAVGFSVAVTSLVGRHVGAGRPDVAVARARLGLGIAVAYMTACALLFLAFRRPMIAAFIGGDVDPVHAERLISIGARLMICAAVFQTFDAVGIVYTGALRGAGDTLWPGVVTIVLSWLFIVGGGWMMIGWAPGLESIGPWIAAAAYIILFGVAMAWRFESGRWRSIDLLTGEAAAAAQVAPVGPAPPSPVPEGAYRDIAKELGEAASE